MDLHVISWNTNGLQDSRLRGSRRSLLRRELRQHVVGVVDVLLIQEHKIATPSGNLMPAGSITFGSLLLADHCLAVVYVFLWGSVM